MRNPGTRVAVLKSTTAAAAHHHHAHTSFLSLQTSSQSFYLLAHPPLIFPPSLADRRRQILRSIAYLTSHSRSDQAQRKATRRPGDQAIITNQRHFEQGHSNVAAALAHLTPFYQFTSLQISRAGSSIFRGRRKLHREPRIITGITGYRAL